MEADEREFIKKIKNFTPKKSFLELQKVTLNVEPETDPFLCAIEKIRKEQGNRANEQ